MSLKVSSISLVNFRNFESFGVVLDPGLTVLVGDNAVGKTNTVEALQLVTSGRSFRRPKPLELLREGAEEGRCEGRIEGDGRVIDVECEIAQGKRTFRRNGKACHAADLAGTLMSILFCPDDLSLAKGSASLRRQEIDTFGSQASQGYDKVVRNYAKAIEQRNSFLKGEWADEVFLDAWDETVALGAATLLYHRASLFGRLVTRFSEVYREISGGERAQATYVSSLPGGPFGRSKEEIRQDMVEALHQARDEDLRRQFTTVGPHRDDIEFAISGRSARTYGSQGQQRSIVLAWKMAEVMVSQDVIGETPLLLLDDVMSELDEARRAALTSFVEEGLQTVVTTTNMGYFPERLLSRAKVVEYHGR